MGWRCSLLLACTVLSAVTGEHHRTPATPPALGGKRALGRGGAGAVSPRRRGAALGAPPAASSQKTAQGDGRGSVHGQATSSLASAPGSAMAEARGTTTPAASLSPASPEAVVLALQHVTLLLARTAGEFWAQNAKVVKTLLAGAVAGIVSRTLTSPLEVVATLQMSGFGSEGTLLQQLKYLHATEGLQGFFKGNGANCLKVAPTRAIQFTVYERLKALILRHRMATLPAGKEVSLSPAGRLFAGGLAGQVAATMVYPLEVVKTMLTVNRGAYSGIVDAFRKALEAGGTAGLFKGWLPTVIAMFPYVGIEFMIYESLKLSYQVAMQQRLQREAIRKGEMTENDPLPPPPPLPSTIHLLLGATAGAAAQTAAHPLDVVRRRLQMQGKAGRPVVYSNMFDGLYHIAKDEGFPALYRGLQPACAEKIPSTAITYLVYEVMKSALGLRSI